MFIDKKIVFSEPEKTSYSPSFCFNQLKCTMDNVINVKRIIVKRLEHLETNVDGLVHALATRLEEGPFCK